MIYDDQPRHAKIGGTEIGIITRVRGSYSSPVDLYMKKLFRVSDSFDNPWMARGRRLEGVIAKRIADEMPPDFKLVETPPIRHPRISWAVGSADRMVKAWGKWLGGLEIKTVKESASGKFGRDRSIVKSMHVASYDMPESYAAQCQWYMFVTGLPAWKLFAAVVSDDPTEDQIIETRRFIVIRDDEYLRFVVGQAARFMRAVKAGHGIDVDKFPRAREVLGWV